MMALTSLKCMDMTVKETGRRFAEQDEVHIWHFNSAGLVSKFGHKLDTYQTWLACQDR